MHELTPTSLLRASVRRSELRRTVRGEWVIITPTSPSPEMVLAGGYPLCWVGTVTAAGSSASLPKAADSCGKLRNFVPEVGEGSGCSVQLAASRSGTYPGASILHLHRHARSQPRPFYVLSPLQHKAAFIMQISGHFPAYDSLRPSYYCEDQGQTPTSDPADPSHWCPPPGEPISASPTPCSPAAHLWVLQPLGAFTAHSLCTECCPSLHPDFVLTSQLLQACV